MPPIDFFEKFDKILFLLINHVWHHSYLDTLMLVLRSPITWVTIFVGIVLFSFLKTGKPGWPFILFSMITMAVTLSSSVLIENIFKRLKPCLDTEINGLVYTLVDCGGGYSFPSSFAANLFGLATFWFFTLIKITGKKWNWLWVWASVVCYAQIYAGQNFPSDVVAGALVGFVSGASMAKIFTSAQNSGFGLHRIFSFSQKENISLRHEPGQ